MVSTLDLEAYRRGSNPRSANNFTQFISYFLIYLFFTLILRLG